MEMNAFLVSNLHACLQAGGRNENMTVRATNNPDDPLGLQLPQFGGRHMTHRFCADDGSDLGEDRKNV